MVPLEACVDHELGQGEVECLANSATRRSVTVQVFFSYQLEADMKYVSVCCVSAAAMGCNCSQILPV